MKMSGDVVHKDNIDKFTSIGAIKRKLEHKLGVLVQLMKGDSILGKRERVAETIEEGDVVSVI